MRVSTAYYSAARLSNEQRHLLAVKIEDELALANFLGKPIDKQALTGTVSAICDEPIKHKPRRVKSSKITTYYLAENNKSSSPR